MKIEAIAIIESVSIESDSRLLISGLTTQVNLRIVRRAGDIRSAPMGAIILHLPPDSYSGLVRESTAKAEFRLTLETA